MTESHGLLRTSHICLGTDEPDSQSVYACAYVPYDISPCNDNKTVSSIADELRKDHFDIGGDDCSIPQTTYACVFSHSHGGAKARLSKEVRSDLRASHFSLNQGGEYEVPSTTYQSMHKDTRQHLHRMHRDAGRTVTKSDIGVIFPFEEPTNFLSESHASYSSHGPFHSSTACSKGLKDQLSVSAISFGSDQTTDYTTSSRDGLRNPPARTVTDTEQLMKLKQDLIDSHFSIGWK